MIECAAGNVSMNKNKKKLGVLLSTGPPNPNLKTAIRLTETALAEGLDVFLYLDDDGLFALNDPHFVGLSQQGAKLFACAYGAQRRGIPISEKANFCGLVVFSDLIKGCDRFVALN
jgi:sulfur relay (sulfurtransferase) complex TusBCD TusD component (DsrE family)